MNDVILRMRGIDKRFSGVHALKSVDFELCKGEVHALMGENGAGKSTLMKVLCGIHQMDAGEIELFIHGARAGRKFELMQRSGRCSFEMECDAYKEILHQDGDVTMRYKSVMGKAEITLLEGEDVESALQSLMNRWSDTREFAWNRAAMPRTAAWRLRVTELSAKASRSERG